MAEQLLVEQDPTKSLIGPELVRVFYACAKLTAIQSNIYSATKLAMKEMACSVIVNMRFFGTPYVEMRV